MNARRAPATSTTAASLSGPPGDAGAEAGGRSPRASAPRELAARSVAEDHAARPRGSAPGRHGTRGGRAGRPIWASPTGSSQAHLPCVHAACRRVERRAGPLGAHHRRAEGLLRVAQRAVRRAVERRLLAGEDRTGDAGGVLGVDPPTSKRSSASKRAYWCAQPARVGMTPTPRQVRSPISKTSRIWLCANGVPSRLTARAYWFSTSRGPPRAGGSPSGSPRAGRAARSR